MIKEASEIMNKLGMDANSFYPAVISIFVPVLMSIIRVFKNKIDNNLWDLQRKVVGYMFFPIIFFVELFVVTFWVIILKFLNTLLIYINFFKLIRLVLLFCLESFGMIINVRYVLKRVEVRKRIIETKKGKFLIIGIIIIMHLYLFISILKIAKSWIIFILYLFLLILEICGLNEFRGYIKYEYSSVQIILNSGEKIECKDISKIKRKHSSMIIMQEDKQIRINYNCILGVEYYGGVKICI